VPGEVLKHSLDVLESAIDGLLRLCDQEAADVLVMGVTGARWGGCLSAGAAVQPVPAASAGSRLCSM
jgi:hypothetical protein